MIIIEGGAGPGIEESYRRPSYDSDNDVDSTSGRNPQFFCLNFKLSPSSSTPD